MRRPLRACIALVSLSLLLPAIVFGQLAKGWTTVRPPSAPGLMYWWGDSNGYVFNLGYTDQGKACRTTDAGQSWKTFPTWLLTGADFGETLTDLHFSDGATGYLFSIYGSEQKGTGPAIRTSLNGGETWGPMQHNREQAYPPSKPYILSRETGAVLWKLVKDRVTVYLHEVPTLTGPTIFGSTDSLRLTYADIVSADVSEEGIILMSGFTANKSDTVWTVLRSTDSGKSWQTRVPADLGVVSRSPWHIRHISGQWWLAGSDLTLYRTSDDGMTWQQAFTSPDTIRHLSSSGATAIIGHDSSPNYLLSVDGGLTWHKQTVTSVWPIKDFFLTNDSTCYFAIIGDSLYRNDRINTVDPICLLTSTRLLNYGTSETFREHKKSFTITNAGKKLIVLDSVKVTDKDFTYVLSDSRLEVGDTVVIDVTYFPVTGGAETAYLQLYFEDRVQAIALRGQGDASGVKWDSIAIDLGMIEIGSEGYKRLGITNLGVRDLAITEVSGDDLSIKGYLTPDTIKPGKTGYLTLGLTAAQLGRVTHKAIVRTNAFTSDTIVLSYEGVADRSRGYKVNWMRTIGDSSASAGEEGRFVQAGLDGSVYVASKLKTSQRADAAITSYSGAGSLQWHRNYDDLGSDNEPTGLCWGSDRLFLTSTGKFNLRAIDLNGDSIWAYHNGSGDLYPTQLILSSDRVGIAGRGFKLVPEGMDGDMEAAYADVFDHYGKHTDSIRHNGPSVYWYNASNGNGQDYIRQIALDSTHRLYACGQEDRSRVYSPNNSNWEYHGFLTKAGHWMKYYIEGLQYALACTPEGNSYVLGASLRRLDGEGNVSWRRDSLMTQALYLTTSADQGVFVAGRNIVSYNQSDATISKFSGTGALNWSRTVDGSLNGDDIPVKVVNHGGITYVGIVSQASQGKQMVVWMLDRDGNESALFRYPRNPDTDHVLKDFVVQSDTMYLVGSRMTGATTSQAILVKVSPAEATVTAKLETRVLELFPNPANERIWVRQHVSQSSYQVLDPVGRVIFSGYLNDTNSGVDIRHLSAGVYFFKLTSHDGERIGRFSKW